MMKVVFVFFLLVVNFSSCKTKKTIDVPPVTDLEEVPYPVTHDNKPLGTDVFYASIVHNDSSTIDLVPIKLAVNNSICVNAYTDFENKFTFYYDKKMIDSNSYLEIKYRGYTRKKIPFNSIKSGDSIVLDQKGQLVTWDQYRYFYEDIRSCTR